MTAGAADSTSHLSPDDSRSALDVGTIFTDPVYAQLGSRSATLFSLSDYDALVEGWRPWHILRQKAGVAKEILRSINNHSWTECRRSIKLIPLKFRDEVEEAAFIQRTNELNTPINWLIIFTLPLLAVAAIAVLVPKHDVVPTNQFHAVISTGAVTLFCVLVSGFLLNRVPLFARHRERTYYCLTTIAYWSLEFQLVYMIRARQGSTVNLRASRDEIELWLRSVLMILEITPVVHADALICSDSTNSFYFHLAILLGGIFSRLFIGLTSNHTWEPFALDCTVLFLLFFVSWSASWYRELRYRCTFHIQNMARISAMRAREYAKRSQSSSIAEEMMSVLRNCQAAVSDRGLTNNVQRIVNLLKESELALSGAETNPTPPAGGGFRSIYGPRHNTRKLTNVRFNEFATTTKTFGSDDAPVALKHELIDFSKIPDSSIIGENLKAECLDFKTTCLTLMQRHADHLKLGPITPIAFAQALGLMCYDNLPYHNSSHSAQTAHAMSCLVNITKVRHYSSPAERIAQTLASFTVNLGNSGRDNTYYQLSNSVLAIATNDTRVIQSMSCALMLQTMAKLTLLSKLGRDDQTRVRKQIIELVINAEDSMNFLAKFRFRKPNMDILVSSVDRLLVSQLCLRLAQTSHDALGWDIYEEWVYRYYAELAITKLPAGDLNTLPELPDICQQLSGVPIPITTSMALPYAVELAEVNSSQEVADFLADMQQNAVKWKQAIDKGKRLEDLQSRSAWSAPHPNWPLMCLEKLLLKNINEL